MSAIYGIYRRDGAQPAASDIERMRVALRHRGPDGDGSTQNGPVSLGHLMLWTTPESLGETLPYTSDDGMLTITADARIDNREQLIEQIGSPRACDPDSRFILEAYRKWGAECTRHLLGDFAFAIWDAYEARLFCATDHFGIKPFYYLFDEGLFAFATEIKGLLALHRRYEAIDDISVAGHLQAASLTRERTYFENVRCLLAAQSMTVTDSEARVSKYWALDPGREAAPMSEKEYSARLRELFIDAVRCRMRSEFPAGSMLSGGLDSSAITCVAHQLTSEAACSIWHTFSAVFPADDPANETDYIDAVRCRDRIVSHALDCAAEDPTTDLERMIVAQDEPMIPGNLYVNWRLASMASDAGVRVVLDGFDGDNVISHGAGYLGELAYRRKWLKLAVELRGYARSLSKESWTKAYGSWLRRYGPWPARLVVKALEALSGGRRRREGSTPSSPWKKSQLLGKRVNKLYEMAARSDWGEVVTSERALHHRMVTLPSAQAVMHILDRCAAAHNIEFRFPFWDVRLVEFCLSLPPHLKLRGGVSRYVFRKAMDGILPPKIQWRSGKADLSFRQRRAMMSFSREKLATTLFRAGPLFREYVDMDVAEELSARVFNGSSSELEYVQLWQAACLSIWLAHIDRTQIDSPGSISPTERR